MLRLGTVIVLLFPLMQAAQQAPATFDVASVKPTQHGRDANGSSRSSADIPGPGRFVAENSSLDELIRFAWDLKEYQVVGPAWLNDDSVCFDMEAKAPPETPHKQMRLMLQALLAERFHLAVHRETRTLPIYELVIAKGGPKLKPAESPGKGWSINSGGGALNATNTPMSEFATYLSDSVDRPVLDKTGMQGEFDLTLTYDPQDRGGERPSIYAALQQQLGLRLQPAKAPLDVLVVDHVDRTPSAN